LPDIKGVLIETLRCLCRRWVVGKLPEAVEEFEKR